MIDLINGYLSAPLLRSYIEIKSSMILQNSINALVKNSSLTQFKGIMDGIPRLNVDRWNSKIR